MRMEVWAKAGSLLDYSRLHLNQEQGIRKVFRNEGRLLSLHAVNSSTMGRSCFTESLWSFFNVLCLHRQSQHISTERPCQNFLIPSQIKSIISYCIYKCPTSHTLQLKVWQLCPDVLSPQQNRLACETATIPGGTLLRYADKIVYVSPCYNYQLDTQAWASKHPWFSPKVKWVGLLSSEVKKRA